MSNERELTLSAEQILAVEAEDQYLLVVAAAGSGKTEVLARRLERVINHSAGDPYRILAVSYTAKAAEGLRERLRSRLGQTHRRVEADTVHGFCLNLLRRYGTRVGLPLEPEVLVRDDDRVQCLQDWLEESGASAPTSEARELFAHLDLLRARRQHDRWVDAWNLALQARGAVDYPAMLDRALELLEDKWVLRQIRQLYGHLAIDEAQNLTPIQYVLVRSILGVRGACSMAATLVGDERQGIVGFAGADPGLMALFEREYQATRMVLSTNYRSARAIASLCDRVAAGLGLPVTGEVKPTYPAPGAVNQGEHPTEEAEAAAVAKWVQGLLKHGLPRDVLAAGEPARVAAEEVAVLARNAAALRYVREALMAAGLEVATASTEDDWVVSRGARLALSLLAYRAAPAHRSTREAVRRLLGIEDSQEEVASAILDSNLPYSVPLSAALEASDLQSFMSSVLAMDVDEDDWLGDCQLLSRTWSEFQDWSPAAEWTFGNFRQFVSRSQRGDFLSPGVRVLTIHRAQGREFRAVAVVALNDGQLPDFRAVTHEQIQDELRVFYVACSRASRMLSLSRARARQTRYGPRATTPSRFLEFLSDPHFA